MNEFGFRTLCIYDDKQLLGCFVYYGDGKYISNRKHVLFGGTEYLEDNAYNYQDLIYLASKKKHDELTEEAFKSKLPYTWGSSSPYNYPYHYTMRSVFNTVIKNNDLIDITKMKGVDDYVSKSYHF